MNIKNELDSFDEPYNTDPASFDLATQTLNRMVDQGYANPDRVDIRLVLQQICREQHRESDYPGAEKLLDRLYFQSIPMPTGAVS